MKNCLNCNIEFKANNGKAKFCSTKCRVAFSRKGDKQTNGSKNYDSENITITDDEPLKFKKPEKWISDIRKYCLENNILPEDLIQFHENHSIIKEESLPNDSKIINEPKKGSMAFFLKNGKFD